MSNINEPSIKTALGETVLSTKTYSTGNVQVFFDRAVLSKLNGYQICRYLTDAADKLVAAKVVPDTNCVQLSFDTGEKNTAGKSIWKPNPQIWCNQPDKTQVAVAQTNDQVVALTASVDELRGMFSTLMTQMSNGNAPAPMATEKPVVDTPLPPTTDAKAPW